MESDNAANPQESCDALVMNKRWIDQDIPGICPECGATIEKREANGTIYEDRVAITTAWWEWWCPNGHVAGPVLLADSAVATPDREHDVATCPYCGEPRADHWHVSPTSCVIVSSTGTPIPRDLGASIVDDFAHDLRRLADA